MSKETDPEGAEAFFQPVSAIEMPRFAGMPSFMRLPHLDLDAPRIDEVEMGLIGVPWDAGTTNRPGPRHGPRQLRDLSTMIRALNPVTGVNPFATVNCADLGDVGPNPIDLADSMARITAFYAEISKRGIAPMTAGGDHLVSLPVLRGLKIGRPKRGALAMIHFDAHTDLFDSYFGGFKYTHGIRSGGPSRKGCLIRRKLRRSASVALPITMMMSNGARPRASGSSGSRNCLTAAFPQSWPRPEPLSATAHHCSYDIDFVDPAYAPGTGTPEIVVLNSHQAQQVVRELAGVNLVGADLVEVSPPLTAMAAPPG